MRHLGHGRHRRLRFVGGAAVALGALIASLAVPVTASSGGASQRATPAASSFWGSPQSIDPGGALDALSCARGYGDPGNYQHEICGAVDTRGDVVLYNGSTWSSPTAIDPGGSLESIFCTNRFMFDEVANFCVAADSTGHVMTYDGSTWSSPRLLGTAADGQTSVACLTSSTPQCLAVKADGKSFRFTGSSWSKAPPVPGTAISAISCPGSTPECVAVSLQGSAYLLKTTRWSTAGVVDAGNDLTSVSCPLFESFCLATDAEGHYATLTNTAWSAPAPLAGIPSGPTYVSCTSGTFCSAVSGTASAVYGGAKWRAAGSSISSEPVTAVACVEGEYGCIAVDSGGNALYSRSPTVSTGVTVGTIGKRYSAKLAVTGGVAPYQWSTSTTLPSWLSFNPSTGGLSGTPTAPGVTTIRFSVEDALGYGGSATVPLIIEPQTWNAQLYQHTSSHNSGLVITHPHIAIVLVGTWWCPLWAGSSTPGSCAGKTGGSAVEQSDVAGALDRVVRTDLNGPYGKILGKYYDKTTCGDFGCTTNYVGDHFTVDEYSTGGDFAPPLALAKCNEGDPTETCRGALVKLAKGYGISSAARAHTVFLVAYAPNLLGETAYVRAAGTSPTGLICTGTLSTNTTVDTVHIAYVSVEDAADNCSSARALGFKFTSTATGLQTEVNFTTWAESHELAENITDPIGGGITLGWYVTYPAPGGPLWQIADVCEFKDAAGQTGPAWLPPSMALPNLVQDSEGTDVAAIVNPVTQHCAPTKAATP